jgi:hypothetical protein
MHFIAKAYTLTVNLHTIRIKENINKFRGRRSEKGLSQK